MSTANSPKRPRKKRDFDLEVETPKGYELIDGQLRETRVSAKSNWVSGQIYGRLWQFCNETRAGMAFPPDSAYRCFPGRPKHSRKPDASFISRVRAPIEFPDTGDLSTFPDLMVEVMSPRDTGEDIQERVQEFQSVGTRLIWVIYPKTREAYVYRADSIRRLGEQDELDGEDVLPGFRCRLADILPPVAKPAAME